MKRIPLSVLALAALISVPAAQVQTLIKKVTLVVNFGEPYIIHEEAVTPFINFFNTMKTEKGFELTILQKTTAASAKQTILNELKNQDVVIFANIGQNSFKEASERTIIENFFKDGGRAIGFHATIDHHTYWPFWTDLHNGSGFQGHGNGTFTLDNDTEMSRIPALGKMWEDHQLGTAAITTSTEIYSLNVYPRGKEGVTVMQTLAAPQQKREYTWHKTVGTGKYIFSCLGHGAADMAGGWMKKAVWGWMEYLKGKYDVTSVEGKPVASPNSMERTGNSLRVNFTKNYSLVVRNVKGENVILKSGSGIAEYDLSGMQPGFYVASVKSAVGSQVMKLVID